MADPVRIGIIGTGNIAGAYARAYKEIPEAEIVALCDIIPGKAAAYGERNGFTGAKTFLDYRKMLAQCSLDAVSISTPNRAHSFIAIDALQAGLHVLCEKPMSVTLEEAVNMARASAKAQRILSIGFQPRYDPNMQEIKRIVQSGALGKVYYVETGGGRRRGMPWGTFIKQDTAGFGAIADIGCYSLDMALNALGYPKPLTVSAQSTNYFGKSPKYNGGHDPAEFEVEDFGTAYIRLEGDIVLLFKISWAMHLDSMGAAFFLGTEGGLKCTPGGTGLWGGAWDGGVGSITLYHDVLGHPTETPIPLKQRGNLNIFTEKVRQFVKAVQTGGPAPIPGEQIVRNQAVIDGILRSAATKREVDIVIPTI
jgi:predicted dehydrogenase